MKNYVNCFKMIPNNELRDELIDLLGEFTDVLTSLADFSAKLYDELTEHADGAYITVSEDTDIEEDDEKENQSFGDNADADDTVSDADPFKLLEQVRNLTAKTLMLDPAGAPSMVPEFVFLQLIAAKEDDMEIELLEDDLFYIYDKSAVIRSGNERYTSRPVFIVKGKPEFSSLSNKEIRDVIAKMEKRKAVKPAKDGKLLPMYRI